MLKPYQGKVPEVHSSAFVEESAQVIGDVSIGEEASIWHNAVLRGDVNAIRIGARTNIQDGCVLHGTSALAVVIDHDVTVGHNAVLHGCRIDAHCLIGMGAIILDHAEIGENCIVGGGTVVKEGEKITSQFPDYRRSWTNQATVDRKKSINCENALSGMLSKKTYMQDIIA